MQFVKCAIMCYRSETAVFDRHNFVVCYISDTVVCDMSVTVSYDFPDTLVFDMPDIVVCDRHVTVLCDICYIATGVRSNTEVCDMSVIPYCSM